MYQIFPKKNSGLKIKLFDVNGGFGMPIQYHLIPSLKNCQLPRTIICTGEDTCCICQLNNRLEKIGKKDGFFEWFFQVHQNKISFDMYDQIVIPVSEWNFKYHKFIYGYMRLWNSQCKSLLKIIIENNLYYIGDIKNNEVLCLFTNNYSDFTSHSIDNMIHFNIPQDDDFSLFLEKIDDIYNSVYEELNIVVSQSSIQTIGYTFLNLIKEYLGK